MEEVDLSLIQGAGSKKKPKKQKPPVESPNTLQSTSKGQILDLVAYGPIKGLVNGYQSIFLDDTPVENPDGTLNFEGVDIETREGLPGQDVIPGFKSISNPREINAEVTYDTPIVRSLLNNEADAVIVTVRVPALVKTNTSNGDTLPASLPLAVHVQDGSGTWNTGVADVIRGKNTSPYERSYRIDLVGTGPFAIRVQRGNKESEKSELRDQLYWAFLSEVIDVRQSYPGCALVGIDIDAKLFGNSMPSRKYLLDLSIIKVPSNYNPETREYVGFWDGTFKEAWTDNPAWCFYDLATHPIIGAGIANVNKWSLYEIGKYCDELVDDGFGGKEPRFTCNTLFSSQEDAITALSTLASVFRGMLYWGAGEVEPVADMPGPVRRILSPSDVIEGEFTYSGTAMKERHSVAVVMWNDPDDQYEAKPEMVEDPEQIELLGWKELRITAVACTSRGQARRVGLWTLYSEKRETQTVTFSVPVKQFDMRPGEFFGVNDPYRSGARLGGRIVGIAGRDFNLDAVPSDLATGWRLTAETAQGGLEQFLVTRISGSTVTVDKTPTGEILPGAGFALSSSAVVARLFRVASVSEQEGSAFSITATEHDPNKYDKVEKGLVLPPPPTSLVPSGRLTAPTNLSGETYTYITGGTEHQALTIGWTAPEDARVDQFVLDVKGPDDLAFITVYTDSGVSFDLLNVNPGQWAFRVRAASLEWGNSAWIEKQISVASMLQPHPPEGLAFTTTSNSITILPSTQRFGAEFEFWRSNGPLTQEYIESNATYIGTGPFFVDVPLSYDTRYYYFVRGVNVYGKSAWVTGNAITDANVDEILEIILKEQQESAIGQWFQQEIEKISGSIDGSVNDRIGVVDGRLDSTVSEMETANSQLQGEIDRIQLQLTEFTSAPVWDPLLSYEKYDVVQWEGKLYSAKGTVIAGVSPANEDFWEKVGDFASLSEAINDLSLRVQASDVRVGVLDGIVTPMASQLTSLKAMWSEDEEDEDGYLEGALRQWDAQAEFSEEVIVRANANEALSQRITALTTQLGDMGASITVMEQSLTTQIDALATRITQLKAQVDDDIVAAIQAEQVARVTAINAVAQDITRLQVKVDVDIAAAINQEATVRADADTAFAGQIDQLDTRLHSAEDDITGQSNALTLLETKVTNQGGVITAQGQSISTVTAKANSNEAKVNTTSSALATTNGKLNNMWGVKMQQVSGGKMVVAGLALGMDNSSGQPVSNFQVKADSFSIINGATGAEVIPFYVSGGRTIIRSALIGDASINMLKIQGDLFSDGYVAPNPNGTGGQGWKLHRDGTFHINSPLPGGGRVNIDNKGMRVYDETGRLRVKIGDLR